MSVDVARAGYCFDYPLLLFNLRPAVYRLGAARLSMSTVTPYATSGALASSRDALRADSDLRAYSPVRAIGGTAQLALRSSSAAAIIAGQCHSQ